MRESIISVRRFEDIQSLVFDASLPIETIAKAINGRLSTLNKDWDNRHSRNLKSVIEIDSNNLI